MGTKFNAGDTGLSVRTELNKLIPENQAEFDPANIVLTDKETYFIAYSQNGELTITNPTNNYGVGASFLILLQTDGSSIEFPSSWGELQNEYASDSDNYLLVAIYNGTFWSYSLQLIDVTIIPIPTLQTGVISNTGSHIDVYVNTGIYGANDGTTPCALSDFTVTFAQNGGTATEWTATSATKVDGNALSGGESIIRINGTLTGTVDGSETLTVTPVDGVSLYNSAGVVMSANSTTGAINFPSFVDFTILTSQQFTITDTEYQADSSAWGGSLAVFNENFALNEDFFIIAKADETSTENFMIGVDPGSTMNNYTNWDFGVFLNSSSAIKPITSGSLGADGTNLPQASGSLIGIRRVSGTITIEYSTNSGNTWTVEHTFAGTNNDAVYIKIAGNASSGGKIKDPQYQE